MTLDKVRKALDLHSVRYIDNGDSLEAESAYDMIGHVYSDTITVDSDGFTTINGKRASLREWLGY